MENFTPISAAIGGILIGLAATLLLAANGRIAGISGIAGGLLRRDAGARGWRLMLPMAGKWRFSWRRRFSAWRGIVSFAARDRRAMSRR